MLIKISYRKNPSLLPSVISFLLARQDKEFHHRKYRLKSPVDLYLHSINRIIDRFCNVLDKLDSIYESFSKNGNKTIVLSVVSDKLELLLYSLMEHIDDTLLILKCFFPSAKEFASSPIHRKYRKNIKEYRDHIATIVNEIKHNQSRVRTMALHTNNVIVPGYYIEGADSSGVLGPSQTIHKKSDTAFSFSRDLRFHFFNLYFIGYHLGEAVIEKTNERKIHVIEKTSTLKNNRVYQLANRLKSMDRFYFPDEVNLTEPMIRFDQDSKGRVSLLVSNNRPVGKVKTFVSYTGITEFPLYSRVGSYRVPYSLKTIAQSIKSKNRN